MDKNGKKNLKQQIDDMVAQSFVLSLLKLVILFVGGLFLFILIGTVVVTILSYALRFFLHYIHWIDYMWIHGWTDALPFNPFAQVFGW